MCDLLCQLLLEMHRALHRLPQQERVRPVAACVPLRSRCISAAPLPPSDRRVSARCDSRYVMQVLTGGSFCSAARDAFVLISTNVLRVAATQWISHFFLALGRVRARVHARDFTHARAHTRMHTHIHSHMHTHARTRAHTLTHTHVRAGHAVLIAGMYGSSSSRRGR